jgi:hypothetical protein
MICTDDPTDPPRRPGRAAGRDGPRREYGANSLDVRPHPLRSDGLA